MDRIEFIEKFKTAIPVKDDKYINFIMVKNALSDNEPEESFGHKKLIVCVEELAELQQAVTKYLRGKEDHYNLLEELADVYLSCKLIQYICNISDEDLNKAINVKTDRIIDTIKKEGYFK